MTSVDQTPVIEEAPADVGPALLRAWIARGAAARRDEPYAVALEDDRIISYGELERLTVAIGAMLAARGIGPGRRVTLLADNSLEQLAIYLGVLAAGATICTIQLETNRAHLAAIVAALGADLVVHADLDGIDDLAPGSVRRRLGRWSPGGGDGIFADIAAAVDGPAGTTATAGGGDHDAVVFFTSGTSGRPKGVCLTYRELLPNAEAVARAFGIGPSDRIHDHRSFAWASAQILSALGTLSAGATLLLARKFSRSRFFADLGRLQATIAAANPTVLNLLLGGDAEAVAGEDLPHLRFITSSSAPLLVADWRRFEEHFQIPVVQAYGSSETGWIAASTPETRRHGAVGKPLPYLACAVVGDDGQALPPGEIGHVEVGGDPSAAFRHLDEDGVCRTDAVGRLRTGDLGFLDPDGYLHLTAREKELIIRGGINVSPVEIDGMLLELPQIAEAATFGVPDPIWGEEIVCVVVPRAGHTIDVAEVLAFCAARLPPAKTPKRIELAASLPRNERGKLDRRALAAGRR